MPRLGQVLSAAALSLLASVASAQQPDIDLDAEDRKQSAGPVTSGAMSEAAASAKRSFAAEKWAVAALAYQRVANGETDDDEGNRHIAEYHLAISLYRLRLHQASLDLFRRIAKNPRHIRRSDTLRWLAKLDTHLPGPADIIGALGPFTRRDLARFNTDAERPIYFQLSYLLGKHRYGERRFAEAAKLFKAVHKTSPYYIKAQFSLGITHVNLRQSVPAVKAFRRILKTLEDGAVGVEDEARMRDLANLSLARVFYSASIELDQGNRPSINGLKLTAAVNHWNRVDSGSEYWLDALFEQSWAYYMAGRFPRALGNIHTLQSPYFPNAFYPEADVVRMVIYFSTCQYEDATSLVAKFQRRYEPMEKELGKLLLRFNGEGGDDKLFSFLRDVRSGKTKLTSKTRVLVDDMLADRQLLRSVSYVGDLDDELSQFAKAPTSFRDSALGAQIDDGLRAARRSAVRKTGTLARKRYSGKLAGLKEHLRSSQKVIVDIVKEQRDELDMKIEKNRDKWTKGDAFTFGRVEADDEHVIWPFDGEYWRDELGFYRQVVHSRCGDGKP